MRVFSKHHARSPLPSPPTGTRSLGEASGAYRTASHLLATLGFWALVVWGKGLELSFGGGGGGRGADFCSVYIFYAFF